MSALDHLRALLARGADSAILRGAVAALADDELQRAAAHLLGEREIAPAARVDAATFFVLRPGTAGEAFLQEFLRRWPALAEAVGRVLLAETRHLGDPQLERKIRSLLRPTRSVDFD